MFKFCVDGAARSFSGLGGTGGVVINAGRRMRLKCRSSLMPSFFVVILTLIECDSSLAAGWVNNENNWPWKLLDIFNR